MIGQTLAHYKILEKIGSGGMGDVYLADDAKLNRKVALKVLPAELAESEGRIARFRREAKAVAALDHPNIVQVFSVEESDGTHFFTMQLVQGKTLAESLPKHGFTLDAFLEIAIPLTDAVASAHREGIVHRDLKPGNVMVSDDGRVKVLDFGLAQVDAQAARVDSETPTEAKLHEDALAGTPHYVSPEQAEGKPIDTRSDIFSLGIVFFEMLTGERPFGGDSPNAVLSSILKDRPDPMKALTPAFPRDLARIVRRCLEKDPARRFQSALDVLNELRELALDVESGSVSVEPPPATKRRSPLLWLSALGVFAAGILAGDLVRDLLVPAPRTPTFSNPVQITSAVGLERSPTWSPDGGRVAYQSDQDGDFDIWVTQVGGGRPLNLTADHEGRDEFPAWSPDGNQIAFYSNRDGDGCFLMSALGGPARRIANTTDFWTSAPVWSSDGSELACLVVDLDGVRVEIVHVESRESRRVSLPAKTSSALELSWSPDGERFAFVDSFRNPDVTRLWMVSAHDGQGGLVTDGLFADRASSWSSAGDVLYFVSNRGGTADLWQQRLRTDGDFIGSSEQLTTGIGMTDAYFSRDHSKLAYTRGRIVANVWRVPILNDRPATWEDAEQVTFDRARIQFADMSSDGKNLLLSSDRSGNVDIWLLPMDGGEWIQLTQHPTPDWSPSWSPDDTEFVFCSYRSGNRDIWVMPIDGGPPRQLTDDEGADAFPRWSPVGNKIVFTSLRGGGRESGLWILDLDSGARSNPVTASLYSSWSPDGAWLLVGGTGDPIRRVRPDGGELEPLTVGPGRAAVTWSTDEQTMYFGGSGDRVGNIWALSMDDRSERPVTDLTGRRGTLESNSLTTDGDYLYFAWGDTLGDIWVMDVAEED